tara:strand:+ start:17792 stop:17920 length:129 start_codon:yes stop_codon:yes gene_type:complete
MRYKRDRIKSMLEALDGISIANIIIGIAICMTLLAIISGATA